MAQSYQLPAGGDKLHTAIKTYIVNALEALRTLHSGTVEPASPIAYMLWQDTTTGYLKQRNAANNAWVIVRPAAADAVHIPPSEFRVASLSATTTMKLGTAPYASTVKRLVIVCETASTSSSGNEWQPMLRKRTNATPGSTVNLFSATVGTFTALGGVGGGAEFVAYKVLVFTPNQNQTLAADDLLELVMTKVGTGTTLANVMAWVEVQ